MSKFQSPLLLIAILVCGLASASPRDEQVRFSSGLQQIALLELYTSEGCSSCPPADQWLSQLRTDPNLWKEFTPIAFHVDYWDYIGWKDRFAQSRFSERQQRYATEGASRFVYTPGFFVNGSEWHGWRRGKAIVKDVDEVGNLSVSIDGKDVVAQFDSRSEEPGELLLHIAILDMGLESKVVRGENTGKTLRHDFVALGVVSVPLDKTTGDFFAHAQLPEVRPGRGERAIVAWVSNTKTQSPIQSVGGLLPGH